jgi:twitching motility protein PilT
MNETGANVLHLRTGDPLLLRIGRKLIRGSDEPISVASLEAMLESTLLAPQWEEFRQRGELDFLHRSNVGTFRAHLFRYEGGWALTMRRIDENAPRRELLGLPEELEDWFELRSGLVLFTGAIGSGKTTTIHSLVRECNGRSARHVLVIENPIEILHEDLSSLVQQLEVGTHVATMHEGIRLARSLQPDLLVVGDVGDAATALELIEAVESGLLVFAAMHAPSVQQGLVRLDALLADADTVRPRERLAAALRAALGQQLVPRQFGTGRVPALEVLVASERAREQLRAGDFEALPETMRAGRGLGMATIDQALGELVNAKEIASDEARLRATDKSRFAARPAIPGGVL